MPGTTRRYGKPRSGFLIIGDAHGSRARQSSPLSSASAALDRDRLRRAFAETVRLIGSTSHSHPHILEAGVVRTPLPWEDGMWSLCSFGMPHCLPPKLASAPSATP